MVGHEYVGGASIETVQADHLRPHAGQAHTRDRDPSADRVQELDLPGDECPGKRNEGADGREQRPESEHQQSAECGEHGDLSKNHSKSTPGAETGFKFRSEHRFRKTSAAKADSWRRATRRGCSTQCLAALGALSGSPLSQAAWRMRCAGVRLATSASAKSFSSLLPTR